MVVVSSSFNACIDVPFGSLAVAQHVITRTSAFGRLPVIQNGSRPEVNFERPLSPKADVQLAGKPLNRRAAFGQERTSQLLGFLLSAAFFRVAFVQLDDDLLDRARHGLETPLSTAGNGVATVKFDHIGIPVGAYSVGWRLCSLDRYKLVKSSHCVTSFSDGPL